MLSDKQCDIVITFLSKRSFTKKYLMSKCLVLFPDDNLPFFIRSIVLRLSSLISVGKSYPCSAIKLLAHWTVGKVSSTAISSVSVELLVLIFCLQDLNKTEHGPVDKTAPLCPFIVLKYCAMDPWSGIVKVDPLISCFLQQPHDWDNLSHRLW